MLGLPVEDVVRTGGVPGVVTARVVRTERHPDAAKVQRVWVDAGDGRERHVWCGAFNFAAGDVVPLATLGTTMPDGRTIARRGILGIDSEGMLCSARELGLGDDHTGILVLPAGRAARRALRRGARAGATTSCSTSTSPATGPTAGRYVGVARDLAAKLRRAVHAARAAGAAPPTATRRSTTVEIVDGDRCGRFTSTVLSGVAVGPSAPWMAERLTAAGMRPINNVVDVSNYVMLELGQPNHAYDLATLGGRGFRIRARPRRRDARRRSTTSSARLGADDLLICDADDRPIGLAGIMGGADTEISDATTTVALEMAWFAPMPDRPDASPASACARRRRRASSAASTRTASTRPIARFVELLAETCPDLVVHAGAVDARGASLPPADRSCAVRVSAGQPDPRHVAHRRRPAAAARPDRLHRDRRRRRARPSPSRRGGPTAPRRSTSSRRSPGMYGYDRVGKVAADVDAARPAVGAPSSAGGGCATCCSGSGITEAMPNPFLAPDTLARAGLDGDALRITNPLVAEESVLRTSLRPGLLRAVAFNESHRRTGVALFEIGHVYPPGPGELPDEYEALGVVLAGEEAPAAVAVWREIAAAMGVGARIDQGRVPPGLHADALGDARRRARRDRRRRRGGARGARRVRHRRARRRRSSSTSRQVLDHEPKPAPWKPTSRHPSSDLDLAFALPDDVPAEKLDKAIRQGAGAAARRPRPVRRLPRRGRRRRPAQPRLPAAAAGARPQPHRRRRRRRARQGHRGDGQARGRAARLMADTTARAALPGWVWVVVPMVVSALLVRRPGRRRAQRR